MTLGIGRVLLTILRSPSAGTWLISGVHLLRLYGG
jgi:hypothetical protein